MDRYYKLIQAGAFDILVLLGHNDGMLQKDIVDQIESVGEHKTIELLNLMSTIGILRIEKEKKFQGGVRYFMLSKGMELFKAVEEFQKVIDSFL